MCGIAGIVYKDGSQVRERDIKSMTDAIAHRGPDDEGIYMNQNFGLGHRRLSIIDLSVAGHQPFTYQNVKVIFNGEIYNYIELRNELKASGFSFTTSTDTEVIAAAYVLWKEDCVNHFNGMWAFCLYDISANKLFCSRDRFGIKPFYFHEDERQFLFASEIKALLPKLQKATVDNKVLLNYLVMGLEDYSDNTFFKDIYKLPASHNLCYDLNTHTKKIYRYYNLPGDENTKSLSLEQAINLFKETLSDSIRLRLRSDVKVGSCLSGGLDSSSITAFASEQYGNQEPFNTIVAKSTDKKNDESSYAEIVSKHTHTSLHVVNTSVEDFKKHITDLVYTQEEPFGSLSILMQYNVFKKAKEAGCIVMLDGQGSDEVLLGYSKYYSAAIFNTPLSKKLKLLKQIKTNSAFSYTDLLKNHAYFGYPQVRVSRLKKAFSYIKDEYLLQCSFEKITEFSKGLHDIDYMQRQEIFSLQLPHLLRYEDKNSMKYSIESRLPFLDYRLVELGLNMNNAYKICNGWTKYPLRKAIEQKLPASIVWRKDKIGFAAPEAALLSNKQEIFNELKASVLLNKLMRDRWPQQISTRHLWRLYNVCLWEKLFNVQD
jgi:asparagine synthase (glutamine-hydrolysing)